MIDNEYESCELNESLMVDFPLRAVELNLHGSWLRILGHTESTDNTEIIFSNTNLANLTNYDAGGKGFTVHGIYGSRFMVHGSKFKGKG